ncbi:MAG: hypothetical protein FD144_444 [Rhodospirillaceae bacterium]|nr:MAG: hypothetical protein FD144_444 [Rhodospirillaceae bacterium]
MKKLIAAAAFAALAPATVQAQAINAQEGFYIGAGGGAAWFIGSNSNASTWTGWSVGGKAGYDFVGPRLELEAGYGQIPTSANIPGSAINGKVGVRVSPSSTATARWAVPSSPIREWSASPTM